MKLIEPDELNDFHAVLARFKLSPDDFTLEETDTTDPKTDEVFALMGFVVITRRSTNRAMQYPVGDGSHWVEEFARDMGKHLFDPRS